ncbi:MAG: hypothetical protein R6V77_06020 [Candidatus Cloacimonadaceae bacterium]
MHNTMKTLLILFLMMSFAVCGFAQDKESKTPLQLDREKQAKQVLQMLSEGDESAVSYIFWDDFFLNDEDITYYYYESVDYGDDDIFTKDIVLEISGLLLVDGKSDHNYTGWSFKHDADQMNASSANKAKKAEMLFYTPADSHIFLREINIKKK